jgi:hypothetical protein
VVISAKLNMAERQKNCKNTLVALFLEWYLCHSFKDWYAKFSTESCP